MYLSTLYWQGAPLVEVVNGWLNTEHSAPVTLTAPLTLLPRCLLNTRQRLPALSVVPRRTSPRMEADTSAPATLLPSASLTFTLTYARWLPDALYALTVTT